METQQVDWSNHLTNTTSASLVMPALWDWFIVSSVGSDMLGTTLAYEKSNHP